MSWALVLSLSKPPQIPDAFCRCSGRAPINLPFLYLWVLLSCFYSINNKITQSVIQTLEVYCVGPLLYISSSRYSSGCPLPAALSCNKTFDGCSCLGFTRVSTAAQVGRYYLALLLDESNQYAIRHYPSSSGIFIRCMPP